MAVRNLQLVHRPLQAGVALYNPAVGRIGTLGLIVARGTDRYILSAAHALVDASTPASSRDVFQPVNAAGLSAVATVANADVDSARDVALARIDPLVKSLLRVVGFGPVTASRPPKKGMEVLKVGAASGVTEGVVVEVKGTDVEVRARPDAPGGYNVCDAGDSGAVWIEIATRAPVALHLRGSQFGPETSFATAVHDLLAGWNAAPA